MKVLFLKVVEPYRVGQVADVAEGYAQNFLLPQKLAVPATTHAISEVQQRKLTQVAVAKGAEQELESLAQALAGATVHVQAAAAATGTLYAAVTPALIAQAISRHTGYPVPPVLLKKLPTLKHTGQHPVTLRIHAATITFTLDV